MTAMPMVDGSYELPSDEAAPISPIPAAFSALVNAVWNVTAHRHDRDQAKVELWSRRAADAADALRREIDGPFGQEESELAVRAAVKRAREKFADHLARESQGYGALAVACAAVPPDRPAGWRDRLGSLFGYRQAG